MSRRRRDCKSWKDEVELMAGHEMGLSWKDHWPLNQCPGVHVHLWSRYSGLHSTKLRSWSRKEWSSDNDVLEPPKIHVLMQPEHLIGLIDWLHLLIVRSNQNNHPCWVKASTAQSSTSISYVYSFRTFGLMIHSQLLEPLISIPNSWLDVDPFVLGEKDPTKFILRNGPKLSKGTLTRIVAPLMQATEEHLDSLLLSYLQAIR